MKRGIVSSRVALLLRSTEIQPAVSKIRAPERTPPSSPSGGILQGRSIIPTHGVVKIHPPYPPHPPPRLASPDGHHHFTVLSLSRLISQHQPEVCTTEYTTHHLTVFSLCLAPSVSISQELHHRV